VSRGQTVCIIEAMKLMNEIEAEVSGVVARILVENAQPVEFGQELLLIRPE
jgi:biotin carboxyl carrier protein